MIRFGISLNRMSGWLNPALTVAHHNLADMTEVLNQIVYQKGGWTLHMLRAQIGTDAFWAGIRDYYRRYRDGNA